LFSTIQTYVHIPITSTFRAFFLFPYDCIAYLYQGFNLSPLAFTTRLFINICRTTIWACNHYLFPPYNITKDDSNDQNTRDLSQVRYRFQCACNLSKQ